MDLKVSLDDRLRAPPQRAAARRRRGRVRRARDRRRCARSRRTSRRSWRSTAARWSAAPVDAHPLTPRQVQQLDAPVIDVRTALQFDDAHIPGAICNTILQAGFGTRLAWIAGPGPGGRARRPRRRRRAARGRAGRGGRRGADRGLPRGRDDELARGAAADGVDRAAHRAASCTSARDDAADPRRARARRVGGRATSRARSSRPTTTSTRCRTELDPARPVAVICASGQRAAVGASLVQRYGAREVLHVVDGGVGAWGARPAGRVVRVASGLMAVPRLRVPSASVRRRRCARPRRPRTRSSSTTAPTRRCCARRARRCCACSSRRTRR